MVCPGCSLVGVLGGVCGGYFGIQPPEAPKMKFYSVLITASLTSITVIGLKTLFNISLCSGKGVKIGNIVQILVPSLVMGMAYSIGVNYLLNHYFPDQTKKKTEMILHKKVQHLLVVLVVLIIKFKRKKDGQMTIV